MPKIKYKDLKDENVETITAKRYYENFFFGIFLNNFKFPELTRSQTRFLLKKLWSKGSVCAYVDPDTKPNPSMKQLLTNSSSKTIALGNENPNGLLILCDYASSFFNIEDEPSVVYYVRNRGATFIPTTPQVVNKDCVIIYAHSSHASIRALMYFFIDKIVDVEQTININLFSHKMPRLIVCSPEDKARVQDLMERIEKGEKALYLDANDVNAIKNVLGSGEGGAYIIDKLKQYEQTLINEALTFLGTNNVPIEKAERLITSEADSNNELIKQCGDCFLDCIKDSCEDVTNILGFPLSVISKAEEIQKEEEQVIEENKEEEDKDNVD